MTKGHDKKPQFNDDEGSKRDIWSLESAGNDSSDSEHTNGDNDLAALSTVDIDYPRPVYLSKILMDVSKWSGYNFVMDPSLNREMQIFAPRKLTEEEAFQLFIASLETIGLRVLQMDNKIVKVVPIHLNKIAV